MREAASIARQYPFSSDMKRMSMVIDKPFKLGGSTNQKTFHTKGAAEVVLAMCTKYFSADGDIKELDSKAREKFLDLLSSMSERSLRSICLAVKGSDDDRDWSSEETPELICVGIVGIQDPLRPEIRDAVQKCKEAGVVVRMVTGDATAIAKSIAGSCGIFEVVFDLPMLVSCYLIGI